MTLHGVLHEVKAQRASKSRAIALKTKTKSPRRPACKTVTDRGAIVETVKQGNKGKGVVVEDGQEHIKKMLLKDLDAIARAMVKKARAGGTAQLRLLWTLGKLDEDARAMVIKRSPSLSTLLMQEIRSKEALKKRIDD